LKTPGGSPLRAPGETDEKGFSYKNLRKLEEEWERWFLFDYRETG
jgi:hypothetical protein